MIQNIASGRRSGTVAVPSSKSCAHRMLICSALAGNKSVLYCDGISKDIAATVRCLNALGGNIDISENGCIRISPSDDRTDGVKQLYCGESGSTLRFLLPVAGALGAEAVFHMEGKLPQRPLGALADELTAHGMSIRQSGDELFCSGRLEAGRYTIPGNISSQYVSGLLFALPLLGGDSELSVTGSVESADYIAMTEDAIEKHGIKFVKRGNDYIIPGGQRYTAPDSSVVERDWSNAAFFLCMGALSESGVTLGDMPLGSKQGDMEILNILRRFGAEVIVSGDNVTVRGGRLTGQTVDASAIPDLVPTVSAMAAGAAGETRIVNAGRLRFKESDRLKTTCDMLTALGAEIGETEDGLVIIGKERLSGGTVDAANDHRIAMAAAVAACVCESGVTVNGAECVEKSFPDFWERLEALKVD